jgi:DNA replication protein DnaC
LNLQHQRIAAPVRATEDGLPGHGMAGARAASRARRGELADFVEKLLQCESAAREQRKRSTLMKLATMPTVKTLEQFD